MEEVQVRFFIPESCIGRLVGKGGSSISLVRENTKVRVQVASDDKPDVSGDSPHGMREVSLAGSPASVQLAAQLLMSFGFADRSAPTAGGVYSVPVQMAAHVPRDVDKLLAQDLTRVSVQSCVETSMGGQIVTFEALPHLAMMVITALGAVSPIVPAESLPDGPRRSNGVKPQAPATKIAASVPRAPSPKPAAAQTRAGDQQETIPLSRVTVGRVIGKGGTGLRLIREASNCHLEVSSEAGVATITGSGASVATAKCLVHMKAAEPYPGSENGSFMFEFYVPQSLAGWIIGKGGETLRVCREDYNASVQILPQGTTSDPAYRPIPAHVRFVSVTASTIEQVRLCLDYLVEEIHRNLTKAK
jgi:predicted RNA-binding protein YlqC (UPF0109 family)